MSEKDKKKHTVAKVVTATAITGATAYAGYSYYVFKEAFDVDQSRFTIPSPLFKDRDRFTKELEWFMENPNKQEVSIISFDGLVLHAVKLLQSTKTNDWIIFHHGYHSCSKDMLPYMKAAYEKGYNVLSIDARGNGLSQGRYTTLGWFEHYDLLSWCGYVVSCDQDAKIALFGVGMGGNAIMNLSGDYVPKNVKCGICDGAYIDIFKEIAYHADRNDISKHYISEQEITVPIKPFFKGIDLYTRNILHFALSDADTYKQLNNAKIPLFMIHEANDEIVPTKNLYECYNACGFEKEKWIINDRGHLEGYLDERFFSKVFGFINKNFQDI